MDASEIVAARRNGSTFNELARVSGQSETEVRRIIATHKKGKNMRFDDTKMKLATVREIEPSIDLAKAIEESHRATGESMRDALKHAIETGRLLTEQKAKLPHGGWLSWVKANLSFGSRCVEEYMGCYRNRDLTNSNAGANLTIRQLAKGDKTKAPEPNQSKSKPKQKSLEFISRNGKVRITNPPKNWRVAKYAAIEDHPALIVCTKCWHYSTGGMNLDDVHENPYECKCPDSRRNAKLLEERK